MLARSCLLISRFVLVNSKLNILLTNSRGSWFQLHTPTELSAHISVDTHSGNAESLCFALWVTSKELDLSHTGLYYFPYQSSGLLSLVLTKWLISEFCFCIRDHCVLVDDSRSRRSSTSRLTVYALSFSMNVLVWFLLLTECISIL